MLANLFTKDGRQRRSEEHHCEPRFSLECVTTGGVPIARTPLGFLLGNALWCAFPGKAGRSFNGALCSGASGVWCLRGALKARVLKHIRLRLQHFGSRETQVPVSHNIRACALPPPHTRGFTYWPRSLAAPLAALTALERPCVDGTNSDCLLGGLLDLALGDSSWSTSSS